MKLNKPIIHEIKNEFLFKNFLLIIDGFFL
jgi:hypothetical protein